MQQPSDPFDSPQAPVPARRGWYPWAVVGMLWFICFFNYADRQAIAAVLPVLEEEFGFSKTQLGWIAASFMWVYALSAPMAGGVGDRVSRKFLILGGLYVWSVVTGFTAACSKLWHFIAVRGAEGLGETFYFPASMSLVSDYHSKSTRSRAMSLHQTSVYAGTIGGAWFAGWMAMRYDNWRYPFVALGVAGVVLGLILAFFIREPLRNEAERRERGELDDASLAEEEDKVNVAAPEGPGWLVSTWHTFVDVLQFGWEVLRNPAAMLLILAFCGANFVAFVFITWLPSFLREKYHLDLASAGFSATFYMQIASMVGAICGGFLADRWASYRAGGRSLVQAIGVLAGAPFIYWCGVTPELTTVLIAMTCFGFAKGIYDSNIWASLYDVVPAEKRAKAVGLTNMLGWIAAGSGATAFGVVVDYQLKQGVSAQVAMSQALSSTMAIYIGIAGLLLLSAYLAPRTGGDDSAGVVE